MCCLHRWYISSISRAEKRKELRHCPAASNVGSSARSFKMIGDMNHLFFKRKNKVSSEKIRVWSSLEQRKIVFRKIKGVYNFRKICFRARLNAWSVNRNVAVLCWLSQATFKNTVIGQTELIITPQCTQPTSHACITYQHMHATYVNSDFVPCEIWQNFTAKCLAACSTPAQYIRCR